MPRMISTLYTAAHIERLTRSLHQIMQVELQHPLPLRICLRVFCAGIGLFRKSDAIPDTYCGHPWSTTCALYRLAGEGYLFDPRSALEAIRMLEARHIVDRRRVEYKDASQRRIGFPVPSKAAVRSRSLTSFSLAESRSTLC